LAKVSKHAKNKPVNRISNNKKKKIMLLADEALQALSMRNAVWVEQRCQQIFDLHPDHPEALNLLGMLASQRGQIDDAMALFSRASEQAPGEIRFRGNLAAMHMLRGEHQKALVLYREILKKSPHEMVALAGAGTALLHLGKYRLAVEYLEKARDRDPKNVHVLQHLGSALHKHDEHGKAEVVFDALLKIRPDHAVAHFARALLSMEGGHIEQGILQLRQAIRCNPTYAEAYKVLTDCKKIERDDEDFERIKTLYAASENKPDRLPLALAMAKCMEDQGDDEGAFKYLQEGNGLARKLAHYDASEEAAIMHEIRQVFSTPVAVKEQVETLPVTPIFIVGMPRSGSTLLEQMLRCHPQADGVGEVPYFYETMEAQGLLHDRRMQPDQMSSESLALVASQYCQMLQQKCRSDVTFIVDKNLTNFLYLGAIHAALPQAKIVHMRRNPMDCCLSMFRNDLQDSMFQYCYDLQELGDYYRMYQNMMEHWRNTLSADAWLESDYEALVASPKQTLGQILDYCGLPWDDACLQFQDADNHVQTASVLQVRQGVYQSSVEKWRRFGKQLAPLAERLQK